MYKPRSQVDNHGQRMLDQWQQPRILRSDLQHHIIRRLVENHINHPVHPIHKATNIRHHLFRTTTIVLAENKRQVIRS